MQTQQKKGKITFFTGGKILTMQKEKPYADVIVIKDDIIEDIGGKDILKNYPDAEIVNLKNRSLLPAFIDSHNHLSSFGCFFPGWANLYGLCETDEIQKAMKKQAETYPDSEIIVGFGWSDRRTGGVDLTRHDLDNFCLDRPVLIIESTFHMSVADTKALNTAGISRETSNPECGIIVRDDEGIPTGILIENAQAGVFSMAMKAETNEHAELIRKRALELLPFGITAVHDPGVTLDAEAAYRILHETDNLPVSVLMMPHGKTILDNRPADNFSGKKTGEGDKMLRTGPVKLFADGATPETVAFEMTMQNRTIKSGSYREDFKSILNEATKRGFRVCIHSFGNATTEAVLNAFEKAKDLAPAGFEMRPRLEHVTLISDSQIKRLAEMKGCACIQPQFLVRAKKFSQAKLDNAKWLPYGDLYRSGINVSASSDDPGGFMDARDPIKGSTMGATMSNGDGNTVIPDQVLPFETWLWMYTAGGAYAGGQENERGMLKKGLVADLVILSGELSADNPPVVDETWKNGKRVYSRQNN